MRWLDSSVDCSRNRICRPIPARRFVTPSGNMGRPRMHSKPGAGIGSWKTSLTNSVTCDRTKHLYRNCRCGKAAVLAPIHANQRVPSIAPDLTMDELSTLPKISRLRAGCRQPDHREGALLNTRPAPHTL